MRLFGIVLLALLVVAISADQTLWEDFKKKYEKSYGNPVEEWKHMKVFLENLRKVIEHNKLYEAGKVTDEKGINEFSDQTDDEFYSNNTGFIPDESDTPKKKSK